MKKDVITKLTICFEEAAHIEQGVEYWMARDIQELLEYNEWRNFLNVIDKAKIACKNSRQNIENHFVDINKMVQIGLGGARQVSDIMLSRYACYLIAQIRVLETSPLKGPKGKGQWTKRTSGRPIIHNFCVALSGLIIWD